MRGVREYLKQRIDPLNITFSSQGVSEIHHLKVDYLDFYESYSTYVHQIFTTRAIPDDRFSGCGFLKIKCVNWLTEVY